MRDDDRITQGRRATDRVQIETPHHTASVDALASKATVSLPLAWRLVSGLGSAASTILLAALGIVYQGISSEWDSMKLAIAEIRQELDRQPDPAEVERLREHVQELNDRLIRLEATQPVRLR